MPDGITWNPLTDDGDALRLAVKLQIDIELYGDHVVAWFDGGYIGTGRIHYDNDQYAATRRAIVRAASAIGGLAGVPGMYAYNMEIIKRFANLVASTEREACAELCERDDSMRWSGAAAAIRQRSQS